MMTIREEVLDQIVEVMRPAEDKGLDGLKAAKTAFPGTPDGVLGEAFWILEDRRASTWWQGVEKTIDGEIIKAALLKKGGAK